jgi:Uma2 family endonuclease
MVNTITTAPKAEIVCDRWIKATWDEFKTLSDDPAHAEMARFYYDHDTMRMEMAALGPLHGRNNSVVYDVISLFAIAKNIRILKLTNTSFRKTGTQECQPDCSFYMGDSFKLPPQNNSSIDLDSFEVPHLVVEIATTSLNDDLGRKRILYEQLGVKEYWVANGGESKVYAFEVSGGRSGTIRESQVLVGLSIAIVEEALKRSLTEDDGAIARWLLQTFTVLPA